MPFPFQTVQAFNPVRPTIILGPAGPTARTAAEQWYQSGYPVKGYVDAPFTIIQRLATPHLIQLAEVVSATALKEWSGLLLDVRLPEDAVRRIIPGSVWIPLDNLRRAIPTLPHDRPILTYCNSGSKAVVAAAELLSAGFDRVAVIP
ncbi:MAG: rhodanese-like domain-containing protein [Firmicutes bacterium]|nr:rhodanese-like domain-containing protein [Bacillota bacterium]